MIENKLYKNRDWLYQKYIIEKISAYRLAKIQNSSPLTIRHWLIKFNIKIRNREQSINLNIKPFYKNKSWLFDQYTNKKKPISEIAKTCNVSLMPVSGYLKKFNIKARSEPQFRLEWRKRQVKLGKKYLDLDWLKEKGKKLNIYEIAKICNTSPTRIKGYAFAHNIKIKEKKPKLTEDGRKSMSESKKGSRNPRWNNGASRYRDHCKLKRNRIKVFESNNYKCEHCEKPARETHHINKNKADHSIKNLLVLCSKCHGKLHRGTTKNSKYRRLYGMSLLEIANKIKLSEGAVWDYFNNKHKSHIETERKMKKLGIIQ